MTPFFSIIIPCYNQAIYLPDCLESILEQSFQNWEAIVVNDGSTDNTKELTENYCRLNDNIRLVQKSNGGLSSARNFGIKNSRGSRLIFLDADDFLYPDALQQIYQTAKVLDDFTLVQYGYSYITEDKQKVLHDVLPAQHAQLIPQIFTAVPGPCHTLCISRKLADAVGEFDTTLKSLEDWDYWLRAAKAGAQIKTINESLVYYRYVRNSMSRNPFVMYESFKTVANRASLKDSRITITSNENHDYNFDNSLVVQKALVRLMGVGVMQNKIEDTLLLFKRESINPINTFVPKDFEDMCSYLSFRYWYSKEEVKDVLGNIKPNFEIFFKRAGYNEEFIQRAIFFIFKRHMFYQNIYRYGKIVGSGLNYLLRKKNNS